MCLYNTQLTFRDLFFFQKYFQYASLVKFHRLQNCYLNNQKIFKAPHPASAAYKGGKWDSNNIFYNINTYLHDLKLKSINW